MLAGVERDGGLPALRRMFWGGDRLSSALVAEAAKAAPAASQVNFYGATETPQAAGFHICEPDADPRGWAPVGRGTVGCQLLVLDRLGRPAGLGEVGEIAVRSSRPSLGYAEPGRIVPIGEPAGEGARLYRTGDRGFHLPDGSVCFIGRTDDQVKVRGHRVELGEVTAALLACPGVRAAAVLADAQTGETVLRAFVAPKRGATLDGDALRRELAGRLPPYMTPATVRVLDALPLSPNGKVDRDALAALPPETAAVRAAGPAPAVGKEAALAAAWSGILPNAAVTRGTTFAELGADSLSYVQGYLATEKVVGVVPTNWQKMTLADLAAGAASVRRGWGFVETPILVRAIGIVMVVATHFSALDYGGGATGALMVVSGFMLGLMPLREAFEKQNASPILRTIANFMIPVALLSICLWIYRLPGQWPEPHILLFNADLQLYGDVKPRDMYLWYIHCLLHVMLIFYTALLVLQVFRIFDLGMARFLWFLFAVGCFGRFVLPLAIDPHFYDPNATHPSLVYFSPTSHIGTMAIGGLIALATTVRGKVLLLPFILAYAGLSAAILGLGQGAYLTVASLMLLAIPRIVLPRFVAPLVLSVAGASLWIYMTNIPARDAIRKLIPGLPAELSIVITIAFGVLLWAVWSRANAWVARATRRSPTQVPEAAV